jgi:LruC domain-containing protein
MKTFNMKAVAAAIVVCFGFAGPTWAANSGALDDNKIKKGVGDMPLTAEQVKDLASYVAEYNKPSPGEAGHKAISFGVDINESANGTEKASSQGVTVEFAWLEVTHGRVTKRYGKAPAGTSTEKDSDFYTETQAWVSKGKATERNRMYTLLGRTGSAQITGSSKISADSTLKIVIPDGVDLSGASKTELKVRLADLNVRLGDPEAFYDYSAGFEDVVLLNEADSNDVDKHIEPRAEAPNLILSPYGENTQKFNSTPVSTTLSWIPKPSAGNYNIVAYEDLFPKQGDYDFNDLVVAYSYSLGVNTEGKVEKMSGQAYILARGSQYTHDWTLSMNLPGAALDSNTCETQGYKSFAAGTTTSRVIEVDTGGCSVSVSGNTLNWAAFKDSVSLFPASLADNRKKDQPFFTDNWFVTDKAPAVQEPKATFSVTFKTPLALSAFNNEDPWMKVTRSASESYRPEVRLSMRDTNNFPFAMQMPSGWQWPMERIPMSDAYPDFLDFVKSSGTKNTDWHTSPILDKINRRPQNTWAW